MDDPGGDNHETLDALPATTNTPLATRYEILGEIGRGGMGIVYKARDRETGEILALKVLKPEIAADAAGMERFKNELRLARKITHKNVCRIHELLRFGDTVVISMELVEGESLRQILRRFGTLPVMRVAQQICAGLREAHVQGVIHRDLKPENVMVDRAGSVKIMDFGIARAAEGGMTQAGALVGTPAYMSPEQAEGKVADHRSDIYSLGLTLYELYTGAAAFSGDTPFAVALKQVHEDPRLPREVEPTLSVHIESVILKCIEKNPATRFQSVQELEAALGEQSLPETPLEADPVPPPHLASWRTADSILLVLAVVGLLCFVNWRNAVFPSSGFVLEVDTVAARREAQELLQRLGRPVPRDVQVGLEYQPHQHVLTLFWLGYGRGRVSDLPQLQFPLYWKISFEPRAFEVAETSLIRWAATSSTVLPERYALLDRQGKLKELVFTEHVGSVPATYRPPLGEERRAQARKIVEDACGPIPAPVSLVETSGGERGAFYSATWLWSRASGAWADVSLSQEKVTRLACNPFAAEEDLTSVQPIFRYGALFLLFGPLARVLFLFGTGQCHRSPLLWTRLPWALLAGVAGGWVVAPGLLGPSPSLAARLGGGLAAFSLSLVGLVAVEHHLRRRVPAGIASYILALRGRFGKPAVALAVVRGAMAGLVLIALETLLAFVSAPRKPLSKVSAFLDPTPVGYALSSVSPALFTVASACLHALLLGLILLGLGWLNAIAKLQKTKRKTLLGLFAIPVYVWLAVTALPLHVGVFKGLFFGFILCHVAWAMALGLVLIRYDVLTAAIAAATATLWSLNYPLLHILRDVGNEAQWGIFAAWAGLIGAAALVAFSGQLRQYLKQE